MNKTLLTFLQAKCKDFGLSKRAIEDLAQTVSEGITDDTSEEDIEKLADSLAPYAKLIQAEVTRKAQDRKPDAERRAADAGRDDEAERDNGEPEWFRKYKTDTDRRITDLESENGALRKESDALKAEKSRTERASAIKSAASRLGIPEFLVRRISIADDADIEKELTEYKQEIVNNRLMPEESADIRSSSEQAAKDDAKAWANSLPNV